MLTGKGFLARRVCGCPTSWGVLFLCTIVLPENRRPFPREQAATVLKHGAEEAYYPRGDNFSARLDATVRQIPKQVSPLMRYRLSFVFFHPPFTLGKDAVAA